MTKPRGYVEHPADPLAQPPAKRGPPARPPRPEADLDRGTQVRVLEGPFAGKMGVVQDLDGRGGARVLLGLLPVTLETKDLAPCAAARARPRLSSSHRKVPARS